MEKKKRKIPRITRLDNRIFADLNKARRPLSIGKLAGRIDASWAAVNNHIKKLEGLEVVKTKKTIRRTNVFLDPNILKELKRIKKLW